VAHLKEQLASRTKALFGDSSDRGPCTERKASEKEQAYRGHRLREKEALPIVEAVHELDEADQACPWCGLDVDSSTLWQQIGFRSRHLLPTYETNHTYVLSSDVIAVVATWRRLM
jgi:hypothetical protein